MKHLIYSILLLTLNLYSQDLPTDFNLESVSSSYTQPIYTGFHPISQVPLIAERKGKIWIHGNSEPLINIETQVTTYFERGLQSFVIDENYVYIYYTVEESFLYGDGVPENTATVNRISRWQVDWNTDTLIGNEEIIIGDIPSLAGNHQGGGMVINDYLFVSTGDGSNAGYGNEAVEYGIITEEYRNLWGIYRSQTLSQGNGKILRVHKDTGFGVETNPYYDSNNPSSFLSRLYDYGYRNPFRMTTDGDKIIVADVGAGAWEEVTEVKMNSNAGWGKYEGFNLKYFSNNTINPDTGLSYEVNYTNAPLMDYGHIGSAETRLINPDDIFTPIIDGNSIEGNSITGGVILKDGFGVYSGFYMFTDFTTGWVNLLSADNSYTINFAPTNTFTGPISINQAPDGSIYITTYYGEVYRIYYEDTTLSDKPNNLDIKKLPVGVDYILYNVLGQIIEKGIIKEDSFARFPKTQYPLYLHLKGYGIIDFIKTK